MIERLDDTTRTRRNWNGRDDIQQHYLGHIPRSEHEVTLTLSWKKEKHAPLHLVGKFRFHLPALVEAGLARTHGGEYILRFQRTGQLIEVARNRSAQAEPLARLPARYFAR